ncbi:MAG TPA: hypothetical protein DIU07_19445, partial [Rhodobacteraceae bacterium]|nr:hypothetical protein [Paracoccaceae bacterium]
MRLRSFLNSVVVGAFASSGWISSVLSNMVLEWTKPTPGARDMELRKLDSAKHATLVAGLFFKANDFVRLTEGVDAGPAQVAGYFKGVP